jgi:hypothetical protein
MAWRRSACRLIERSAVGHVGEVNGQVHHPIHRTARPLQRHFQRLQGAFALQGDIAQFQAAIGAGRDLGRDQNAVETDNIRGNRIRIRIRVKLRS